MNLVKNIISIFAKTVERSSKNSTQSTIGPGKKIAIKKPIKGERDGIYFKSKMEANVWRFYKFLQLKYNRIIQVEYEPEIFFFNPNEFGIKAYVPDFKITLSKSVFYVEVKGYVSDTAIKKARLVSKDYSGLRFFYITPKEYKRIYKFYAPVIADWE